MEGPALVGLANDMLAQLHVPTRVQHWSQIKASVFVTLFEGLCGESLPDVIQNPRCREDETHNCQCVIDTLSLDILNTSLSHITGDDIASGDMYAIGNLLEVFSGLLEYIIDKIGSEPSTDVDDRDRTDPDLLTPDQIDDALERELGHSLVSSAPRGGNIADGLSVARNGASSNGSSKGPSNRVTAHGRATDASRDLGWGDGPVQDANSTAELIALGNVDSSWMSQQQSPNKTADLIALGTSDSSRHRSHSPDRPIRRQSPDRLANQHSPDRPIRRRSPDRLANQHSPDRPIRRRSPDRIANQHSPDRPARRRSPDRLANQHSPDRPVRRRSPDRLTNQHSPDKPTSHSAEHRLNTGYASPQARLREPTSHTPPNRDPDKQPSDDEAPSSLVQKSLEIEKSLGLVSSRRTQLDAIASSIEQLRTSQSQNGTASGARVHSADTMRRGPGTDRSDDGPTGKPLGAERVSPGLSMGVNSSLASSLTLPGGEDGRDDAQARSGAAQFESVGVRPRPESDRMSSSLPISDLGQNMRGRSGVHHTYTHHLYHHYNNSGDQDPKMSSLPISSTFGDEPNQAESRLSQAEGSCPESTTSQLSQSDNGRPQRGSASQQTTSQKLRGSATAPTLLLDSRGELPGRNPSNIGGQRSRTNHRGTSKMPISRSYENLENLMKDTVEFARAAVKSSPLRERPVSANSTVSTVEPAESDDSRYKHVSRALRSAIHEVDQDHAKRPRVRSKVKRTRQTNVPEADTSTSKSILSPGKRSGGKKNVSFVTSRSQSSSETSIDRHRPPRPHKSRVQVAQGKVRLVQDMATNTTPVTSYASVEATASERLARERPSSFKEYLQKYYGRDRLRSSTDDTDGYDSDGGINYRDSDPSHSADTNTLEAEIERYRQDLHRKAKAVRFDDILDDSAPGRMGGIRRKLKKEDQKARFNTALIDKTYQEELLSQIEVVDQRSKDAVAKAKQVEDVFKKTVLKDPQTKYKPVKKYSVSAASVIPRNRSRKRSRSSVVRARKRSYSASPTVGRSSPVRISDQEILPWLLEEFPYLHLSSETIHDLWRKSARQIQHLSKAEKDLSHKKSKAQKQIEEAERKQEIMMNIMKKELHHNQKMRELKERRKQVVSVKSKIRDKRMQSVRCRRYYEEYQLRMRSKMLKKSSKEELLFKKLYKEGLEIQKDRISELRQYTKEQRQHRAKKQQQELESLENYYKDQFAMLAESMARERDELDLREHSQSRVMDVMKKELRKKMEREIQDFQEQLYRDEDDTYFRELDADRLRQQLHMARYQAKV